MIRRFKVKVNGRAYEVEIEELASVASRSSSAQTNNPSVDSSVSFAPVYSATAGIRPGEIVSPIPGKVLQVMVEAGQEIQRGDELLIVESMKIENPILATRAGIVKDVKVAVGDQVRPGDLLVVIE